MTIKEIENLSGLTRANIYFYEEKGLLHPNRNPNGYRNYSNEDLESLQKIRLLRTLHISVEDINAIILGKRQLSDVLASHIRDLRMNENDLHHCREICSQIHDDQADYSSLDWQQYMDLVDTFHFKSTELQDDSLLKVTAPWKRFFARGVDLSIYGLINNFPRYLYKGYNKILDIAKNNSNLNYVYICDNNFTYLSSLPEFMVYNKTKIINVNMDDLEILKNDEELKSKEEYILCIKKWLNCDEILKDVMYYSGFNNCELLIDSEEMESLIYKISYEETTL